MEQAHVGACCAFALLAGSMLAQAGARAWTPDELAVHALANNAELEAYELGVAAAKGERMQSAALRNPEVALEIGGREVRDSENVLAGNGTTLRVAVLQTFEFPGKKTLGKAIADKNVRIAELGLEQFRLALAGKVRLLAFEFLAASVESEVAERVRRRSEELARSFRGKVHGARQTLEFRLVDGSLLALRETVRAAEVRRETARAELVALLGWPPGQPLVMHGGLPVPLQNLKAGELALAGQKNNPLLQIRRVEAERASHQVTAARLEIAPDLSIGPFFARDAAGDVEQNFGGAITATLPIWDWNSGNIAAAKARREQAEAMRVQAEREAEAAIVRTARLYEITVRHLRLMPEWERSNLREASALADQQYRAGAIGMRLYLDVQRESVNAVQVWHGAVLEAWRSLLDLDLLTGGNVLGKGRP